MLLLAMLMPVVLRAQADNYVIIQQNATGCNQYTWARNGQTYTAAGVYTFVEHDTVYLLNLALGHEVDTTIGPIAAGCFYDWGTMHITQTGIYDSTFTSTEGCDSVVTLMVNINPTRNVDITDTICGEYYDYGFNIRNMDTTLYMDTAAVKDTTIDGCNYHITLALHIAPIKYHPSPIDTLVICDRYTFKLSNLLQTTISITEDLDTNTNAVSHDPRLKAVFHPRTLEKCYDSTTFFHFEINKSSAAEQNIVNCGPLQVYVGDTSFYFTFSRQQKHTLTKGNAVKCDSVITLNVHIDSIPVVTITGNLSVSPNSDVTLHANSNQSNTTFMWNNKPSDNNDTYTIQNVTSNTDVSLTGTNPTTKCTSTSYVTILCNVGINEAEAGHVKVFPNPAATVVNVESDNNIQMLAIYNAMGQQVYSRDNMGTKATLDITRFANGVYTMQVMMENGNKATRTMIVNK